MDAVFTAEALYSCPMHPEIVTEDADLKCPLCNMKLNKMTDKQVKQLQDSHPKGCVMCPIVVKGDSDTNTCATCKMKLVEIKDGGHQEHKHDVPH